MRAENLTNGQRTIINAAMPLANEVCTDKWDYHG